MSYAIVWRRNQGPGHAGMLELEPQHVHLVGGGAPEAQCDVRYDELEDVYVERSTAEANSREPALVLSTRAGDRIAIGSLEGVGALHELADSVAHERRRIS
jgi:hypothetical protein